MICELCLSFGSELRLLHPWVGSGFTGSVGICRFGCLQVGVPGPLDRALSFQCLRSGFGPVPVRTGYSSEDVVGGTCTRTDL